MSFSISLPQFRHPENEPSSEDQFLWGISKEPVASKPVELRVMLDNSQKITTVCSKKGNG